MLNKDKSDVRVFKINVSVLPKVMKAVMEMRVAVGDEIKQEIPLVNNSDNKDWPIKI